MDETMRDLMAGDDAFPVSKAQRVDRVGEIAEYLAEELDLALRTVQLCMVNSMEAAQRLENIREKLLNGPTPSAASRSSDLDGPCHVLTEQEARVLEQLCRGRTNRQIGRQLSLTEKTVKNYVNAIFGKLKVHSRTEAAMFATRLGWFQAAPRLREGAACADPRIDG